VERLRLGHIRVLVTDTQSYVRKVEPHRDSLSDLDHVLLTDAGDAEAPAGTTPWSMALAAGAAAYDPETFTVAPTRPDDPALLHFKSGTKGKPKGPSTCTRRSWPTT
jgi:acetyl-CoA synthetase